MTLKRKFLFFIFGAGIKPEDLHVVGDVLPLSDIPALPQKISTIISAITVQAGHGNHARHFSLLQETECLLLMYADV